MPRVTKAQSSSKDSAANPPFNGSDTALSVSAFLQREADRPSRAKAMGLDETLGDQDPHLRQGRQPRMPAGVPPLAEQHQIVAEVEARITAIDHLEAEVDRQITRSNRLRQSILAAEFSGNSDILHTYRLNERNSPCPNRNSN